MLLVNVIAADVVDLTVNLEPQASLFGRVLVLDPTTGQFVPFGPCPVPPVAGPPCGAVVRLFDADAFPGLPSQAIATAATDANGGYTFPSLPAPDDFVVSVYVGHGHRPARLGRSCRRSPARPPRSRRSRSDRSPEMGQPS